MTVKNLEHIVFPREGHDKPCQHQGTLEKLGVNLWK